ncbi:hypothetical protein ACHHYP_16010 [Achlya hypogyna]|uniref:Uncharacterized protein n=1 Tax=Achlya hypogyna TaxID=1202772 RepID=A0A1V9ZEC3_ACHHY|nr:hypothetical protein ACHHYP_16010 [Achlya hypogyna]
MKAIFDDIGAISLPSALYTTLLDMEATYVSCHRKLHASDGPHPESFPHSVYQLHPLLYALGTNPSKPAREAIASLVGVCTSCKRQLESFKVTIMYVQGREQQCLHCEEYQRANSYYKTSNATTAYNRALRDVLGTCPHRTCRHPLPVDDLYRMHILDETIQCSRCSNNILYETYQIATFIQEYPTIEYKEDMRENGKLKARIAMPKMIPADGLWTSYTSEMQKVLQDAAPGISVEGMVRLREHVHSKRLSISAHPPGAFTLDLVQGMYRQLNFVHKVCTHFDYWMDPAILAAAIRRYEQFVHLIGNSERVVAVPTVDIDLVWHTHQTHPQSYYSYSTAVARRMLDHDDTVGSGDLLNGYLQTCTAWSKLYKTPYSSYVPATTSVEAMRKAGALVATGAGRFYGVDEVVSAADVPMLASLGVTGDVMVSVVGTPVFETRLVGSALATLLDASGANGKTHKSNGVGCVEKGCAEGNVDFMLDIGFV